jgi:hypothetical protein
MTETNQKFSFSELSDASQKRAIKNTIKHFPDSYPSLKEANVEGLGYADECVVEDIQENGLHFNKKGEIV